MRKSIALESQKNLESFLLLEVSHNRNVNRAMTGDTEAFEDLVRRHECRVFRTTVILPGNADDAEEALQDAFLNAYQHLGIALHAPKLRDGIHKFMDPKATPLSRRNRR